MGSNLKKIRSLNLNIKILLLGLLFPLGFSGTFLLNNFLKETYSSRKLELEESIENLLDKNVELGDYVGIRFLGFSLGNSKILSLGILISFGFLGTLLLNNFLQKIYSAKKSEIEKNI